MTELSASRRREPQRRKRVLLVACLALLLLAASPFLLSAYVRAATAAQIGTAESAAAFDADCILVLGAGVRDDGTPSPMLEDRLLTAIALYRAGVAPKLLMSGDHGTVGYDEVNTMKAFAIAQGVPSEDIFMDHAGFATYDSVYRARDVFAARRVVVVTQEYHLYRALYIANALELPALGVAADLRPYGGQTYYSLREIAARAKDALKCAFRPPPALLGETIPVSGSGDVTNDQPDNGI